MRVARSMAGLTERMRRASAACGAFAALSILPGTAFAQDWDKVVAEAKREGELVIYSTGDEIVNLWSKAFRERFGINIRNIDGRATEIQERIRIEQATGRRVASLSYNGSTTSENQKRQGAFQPHGGLPNAKKLVAPFQDDGIIMPVVVTNYGILINTGLVKAPDEPKTWRDIVDPKWSGKILMDDPRVAGGGSVFFDVTQRAFGNEFHQKLAGLKPFIAREFRDSQMRLARGEYAVYIPSRAPSFPLVKGLPVKFISPEEGAPYVGIVVAILKEAPHLNAARLFANFVLEDDMQLAVGQLAYGPTTAVPRDKVPAEYAPLVFPKPLGTTDKDPLEQILARANQIYK